MFDLASQSLNKRSLSRNYKRPFVIGSTIILILGLAPYVTPNKALAATDWYVAPNGSASASGTVNSPWSLTKALSHPSEVKPGDTIWLRGGVYPGKFTSRLTGTASAPINVRQYPGERATIDSGTSSGHIFVISGAYTWYWDFELMSSSTGSRVGEQGPTDRAFGLWTDQSAPPVGVKLINLIVHDTMQGSGLWAGARDMEVYGLLSYNNGWKDRARDHGPGIYSQNDPGSGTKFFGDVIINRNWGTGVQVYGSAKAFLDNFHFDGGVYYNNLRRDFLIGGGVVANSPKATNNFVYDGQFNLGHNQWGGCTNATMQNNYIYGDTQFYNCTFNSNTNNTFIGSKNFDSSSFPNNTYISGKPTVNRIFVRPNKYESGRANIIIYNWELRNSVTVDVSNIGLQAGDKYELHNADNYFGDVITGTYTGSPITVPMTGRTIALPYGHNEPIGGPSFPEFGVFIIKKQSGTASATVPSDSAPPVRSGGNPKGTLPVGTANATLSLSTDEASTCRYDVLPNRSYSTQTTRFAVTGSTNHSTTISGLTAGRAYAYYIRCQDLAGNANPDDFAITFSVAETPAQNQKPIGYLDGVSPNDEVFAQVFDEDKPKQPIIFGWAEDPDNVDIPVDVHLYFDGPAQPGRIPIAASASQLRSDVGSRGFYVPVPEQYQDGQQHSVYVYAIDLTDPSGSSNSHLNNSPRVFTVQVQSLLDTTAPLLSGGSPSGTLPYTNTSANLLVTTNEAATCKYSASPNVAYAANPNLFSTTGSTFHRTTVSVIAGQSYNYYIRCQDLAGNANPDDYHIFFDVAAIPGTPPPPPPTTPPPAGGELLYNGIVLPEGFPAPRSPTQVPQVPTYLTNPPSVIPIDVGRQLFVDDFLIESTNLSRVQHTAQRMPNPVLTLGGPDNQVYAMPFSDGVWYDPVDQLFKMWYFGGPGNFPPVNLSYAYSTDGVNWVKPVLPNSPVPNTNVVVSQGRDSGTVWMDLEETDPDKKFKYLVYCGGQQQCVFYSPDGINWTRQPFTVASVSDRTTFFWNPFRSKWIESIRGGSSFGRARYYAESNDLINWTPNIPRTATFWTAVDNNDPNYPGATARPQLYNLDAVAYESVVLGMFSMFYPEPGPDLVEINAGFSRDGFQWVRPTRGSGDQAFVRASNVPGTWDYANTQSAGGVVLVVGDELWFYHSARNQVHSILATETAAGLAKLRRDGFYSMNAGVTEGALTTRPVRFTGNNVFINVNNPGGSLQMEILDANGNVIAPFSRVNSIPVSTDSTRTEMKWNGAADVSALRNQTVKFRFYLSNGELYSFWVSPSANGASNGYVGAGGPGFTTNIDNIGNGAVVPPPPPPPPPPVNQVPIGFLDGVDTSGNVFGWAQDPDSPNSPIDVHLYFDGPAGVGTNLVSGLASNFRSDVGSHGFSIPVPQALRDGQQHSVYAYGIDLNDPTGASNVELGTSPKVFVIQLPPDTTPPSVSLTAPVGNSTVSGNVAISAFASDPQSSTQQVSGVAGVQFLLNGNNLGAEDTSAPYSISWDSTTVINGNYTLSARARDAAGNIATSNPITVAVNNQTAPPPPTTSNLVMHWRFDEGSGNVAFDSSNSGRTGTLINNPTWAAGKLGGALSFDGINDYVSGASGFAGQDAITISAWVKASQTGTDDTIWRGRITDDGVLRYDAAGSRGGGNNVIRWQILTGQARVEYESASNVQTTDWQHIVATWSRTGGSKMYINGVLDSPSFVGTNYNASIKTESNNVGQGGLAGAGPWSGLIDDFRVYDRVLTGAEIQQLFNDGGGSSTPPGPSPDTTPPSVSLTAPVGNSTVSGNVAISAFASDPQSSTQQVSGVAGVQFLLNGNNLGAEDTSAPYSISWDSTTVINGNYTLSARARDAAGNIATSNPITVAVNNQTAPPPPTTSNLVMHWKLDEGTGTTANDASGNNNHGTLTNGPTWAQGKIGSAVSFDGNNDNIPGTFGFAGQDAISIAVWVKADEVGSDRTIWRGRFSDDGILRYDKHGARAGRSNIIRWQILTNVGRLEYESAENVQTTDWQHIVATWSRTGGSKMYINGVLDTPTFLGNSVNAPIKTEGNSLGAIGGGALYWSGLIDDFRVYDRVLSPSEVSAIYNGGVGVVSGEQTGGQDATTEFVQYQGLPLIYLLRDKTLHPIPSWDIFRSLAGPAWAIRFLGDNEAYSYGRILGFPDRSLVKGSGPTVYLIENGSRRPFADIDSFRNSGFTFENVISAQDRDLSYNPIGDPL